MPGNEITYKFIKGRGWVAGYWEDDVVSLWRTLEFSEIEQRILDRVMQNMYQQIPLYVQVHDELLPHPTPAPPREPPPRRYSARDWYARRLLVANELRNIRAWWDGDDE